MSLKPLKITFNLDGRGCYFDPFTPIHLDDLIASCLNAINGGSGLTRDDKPEDLRLPLGKWHIKSQWGWHASALIPDSEDAISMQWIRKKFRESRTHLTKGSVSLGSGIYREFNIPTPLSMISKFTSYALGDRHTLLSLLKRNIKFLGKKRSIGYGKVSSIEGEVIESDYSVVKDGLAMRFLPDDNGLRLVRVRPPYFHPFERTNCCEVGDIYEL